MTHLGRGTKDQAVSHQFICRLALDGVLELPEPPCEAFYEPHAGRELLILIIFVRSQHEDERDFGPNAVPVPPHDTDEKPLGEDVLHVPTPRSIARGRMPDPIRTPGDRDIRRAPPDARPRGTRGSSSAPAPSTSRPRSASGASRAGHNRSLASSRGRRCRGLPDPGGLVPVLAPP